jgi:hypothetical protein
MSLIRINRDPSRRDLAVFGLAWLVFFGALAAIALVRAHHASAVALAALALLVPLAGRISPALMRLVWLGMAYLSFPIGFVLSFVILALVYYLVLTPTGLLMRLAGRDPMARRFDPRAESYWSPRPEPPDSARYFRQF